MNAYETPLIELLKKVPIDARHIVDEEFSSTCYPVGRLCSQAADRIVELEKLVSELKYEKSSGVYDHPQKELTDEKILRIYTKYSTYYDDGRLFVDVHGFARAIEKELRGEE